MVPGKYKAKRKGNAIGFRGMQRKTVGTLRLSGKCKAKYTGNAMFRRENKAKYKGNAKVGREMQNQMQRKCYGFEGSTKQIQMK